MPAWLLRSAVCGLVAGLAVAAHPAAAAEARAVADLLAAAIAATGEATVAYDTASGEGDSVTLTGFRLTLRDGSVATIPALVISGIGEREPGGFTAASIGLDAGKATGGDNTATWASGTLADVIVPSADEVKNRTRLRPFRHLSIGAAGVSGAVLPAPIDAASVSIDIGDVVDGSPGDVFVRVTGVRLPAALFANSIAGTFIGMLDYQEFVADVAIDGAYDAAANTAALRSLTIDIPSVGKITLAGKASGFSVRGLTDPDAEVAKAARANARLDALRLRLDNGGFVERMLDMQAGMLGGTRDDVRAQLVGGALPFALSFVENEAFRAQFLAAIDAFLEDPRSLTITFQPVIPVPLGQVVRTAARAPMTLPDLLAPTVEANN